VKAPAVRAVATAHDLQEIAAAIEAIAERGEEPAIPVEGDSLGEKLTHLLLAQRIRTRMGAGEDLKDAFRAEMAAVRGTLTND
jgi:hypothetical protein